MIKEHHERYIEWSEVERNQKLLAANAYGKPGGPKSGRGGRALIAWTAGLRPLRSPAQRRLLNPLEVPTASADRAQIALVF